jgi:hypothetical protein
MLSFNCKNVQHVKIYTPCNFEVNPITHFGVISLFSSNFQHFINRHGGHDGWSAGSSDKIFKGNPLRMIQAKFGLNWRGGFRGEYLTSISFEI